jgi:hypothetical protein
MKGGVIVRFAGALLVSGTGIIAGQQPQLVSCGSAEYRQFDFWVGDWDVSDVKQPDSVVARARVELILGRCALLETYDGKNGLSGQSFSMYDSGRRVWHQSWVTNRGQLLVIEGRLEGDRMVLSGPFPVPSGKPGLIRGIWYVIQDGVRETAETSEDGGKSWKPLFDLVFRKRSS